METNLEETEWDESIKEEQVPNDKNIVHWIAAKPLSDQEQVASQHFLRLLEFASQPRHASGNACVKLCYFLELCRNSPSVILRNFAFSHRTCIDLFKFYVEWNEKNQHRSMKQVLEVLASLINFNPDKAASSIMKTELLQRLVSIITHKSAQSFVKPSFRVLECFLSKSTISVTELMESYGKSITIEGSAIAQGNSQGLYGANLYDPFVLAVFEWMSSPDTSPAAGKLLVTLFQKIKVESAETISPVAKNNSVLWQQWIRHGLARHSDSLENIKNYLFPALFKFDRLGSLDFLQDLAKQKSVGSLASSKMDAQAFLLLSAMEVGKKSGLVDESDLFNRRSLTKARNFIAFPEDSIGALLSHRLSSVRSTAFSVLVSSVSSTKPFPSKSLNLLSFNLGLLHLDTDAKFRNEVLSNSKHMIGRLKGAVSFLTREVASFAAEKGQNTTDFLNSIADGSQEALSLQDHLKFVRWYLQFLSDELIPTASYQRHITALRAIHIVIDSGIVAAIIEGKLNLLADSQSGLDLRNGIFTTKLVRLLLDLLMDPFEDVRATANQLLKLAPANCFTAPLYDYSSGRLCFESPPLTIQYLFSNVTSKLNGQEIMQEVTVPENLLSFIERTDIASRRTGRADLADGVARTYELLYGLQATDAARLSLLEGIILDLEQRVTAAEDDLARAVLNAPVHGQFAAIRLVWDRFSQSENNTSQNNTDCDLDGIPLDGDSAWIDMQYHMIGCCTRIWAAVKDVLCNDSPEGYLPQDLDELDILDTKDMLSYSFRAIHESSNLLRVMVNKLNLRFPNGSPVVPFEVFRAAGVLSFEQLSSLRHRGAFSTVSLTFARCCQLTQEATIIGNSGDSLLKEWYQGALNCIYEQASTTRRSAGIPALMAAILAANSRSFLEPALAELQKLARKPISFIAKDETSLPQVHAMNCLKEIFKSSSLGKRCENHISDCLQLAAESLRSKIWALRNCGLLLLRSLIDCLFGTSESKLVTEAGWDGRSVRLAYERYPTLPGILLNLLANRPSDHFASDLNLIGAVESVFPALDIIRRAGPPKDFRGEIYGCIKAQLGSAVWHVRDIAARTICTLLLDENWLSGSLELLESCSDSKNQIHGVLLAVKHLLQRRLELNPDTASGSLEILMLKVEEFWTNKSPQLLSPVIEAAYEEVAVVALKIIYLTKRQPRTSQDRFHLSTLDTRPSAGCIFLKAARLLGGQDISSPSLTQTTFSEKDSALLARAVTIHALHVAAAERRVDQLKELVMRAIQYDAEIACGLLDHIPFAWNMKELSADVLADFVGIYIETYIATSSSHIRNCALRSLADTLEQLFQSGEIQQAITTTAKFRQTCLPMLMSGNPDLSNSEIRITGSVLAIELIELAHNGQLDKIAKQIQVWGSMLSNNGKSEHDFDTRYAAVAAMGGFYSACSVAKLESAQSSFFIPSLLALYDILNDDDDDIREAGANVVFLILGSRLVPRAASAKLLHWLHQKFGDTSAFCTSVIQRITNFDSQNAGKLQPMEQQLASAMLDDDSLFAEEEQNLYIDEVSESIAWTSILRTAEGPLWDDATASLSEWTIEGLVVVARLAESCDGPFGWLSKPRVFNICMKIVLTANALLARCDRYSGTAGAGITQKNSRERVSEYRKVIAWDEKQLRDAARYLLETGHHNKLHPIILEELEKSDILTV